MIIYNGKSSLKDFDLYVASKNIPVPERKVITETVPYMSGLWDFSFLDGVDQYEAVTLVYDFDVIADSKRELNELKAAIIAWLHGTGDNKLYDTDISTEFYYTVYHAQASWNEDGLQGLVSVSFLCYPFRKAKKSITMKGGGTTSAPKYTVINAGARKIKTTAFVEHADVSVTSEAGSHALSAGTYKEHFVLPVGATEFTVKGYGTLILEYEIEVL